MSMHTATANKAADVLLAMIMIDDHRRQAAGWQLVAAMY